MDLQSSSEHWAAPTWQAWAALHPWSATGPTAIKFKPLIRSLFDGTERPSVVMTDDIHRMLIVLTFIRALWGTKESEDNPLNDAPRDSRNRERILEILDSFMDIPADPTPRYTSISRMGVGHMLQVIHMAHLIGAGNMMDWLYTLVRGGPDIDNARKRMHKWAAQDPARVREVAYRSAQILSIIRQYPYNLPQEPFNAFHAGAVLWCVAGLLPQSQPTQLNEPATLSGICRIDTLGSSGDVEVADIKHWVREGGPQIVSLYNVSNLCSRLGRREVLEQTANVLRRMCVWGIAQNFLEVILGLIDVDRNLRG